MRLQNYTLRFLVIALLIIIAIWAALFYAYILEEVYDNIDDGLKNSRTQIIKEAWNNPEILKKDKFGINNFRITPLPPGKYSYKAYITTTLEYLEYDNEDEPIRLLTTVFRDPSGNPYKLEIKTSTIEEDDLLADLSTALIFLYVMLVISIFILNYFILKRVWKSFYKLLHNLKNYTLGSKENFTSPHTKIKEFKDLEIEIEKMIQRNENIFNQQKLFISNASHELQTPLAISINKLELLAEDPNITEKQMKEIVSISDSLNRLVKLNKSLLMLTKIENNQYIEKKIINFNDLIQNIVDDFSDWARHKKITINLYKNGVFQFEIDKGLAITLINNLIKNAITHNFSSGYVNIIITDSYFLIQNTSTQNSLDTSQIYNRFYRNATDSQCTGLGLSLVKTIVDKYPELSIEYFFDQLQNFKIQKK